MRDDPELDLGEIEGRLCDWRRDRQTSSQRGRHIADLLVETQIGGKLAQLGQRLINGAAKKVADQFLRILLG